MTTYRAASPETVRIEPLDTLTLVYHRLAGATHLLAEPAPEILAALMQGPICAEGLLERLAADFDLDATARDGIAAHLQDLVAAGLVTAT